MRLNLRDYPIKIKLQPEERRLLAEIGEQSGKSASEVLRDALEYALRHTEELDRQIQTRKLPKGEALFQYYELPKEQRNQQLLVALAGRDNRLRCNLMIVRDSLSIMLGLASEHSAELQNNALRVRYSFSSCGNIYHSVITLNPESILSVSTYNARTNQTGDHVPVRFESLTENEYLQITVR